MGKLFEDTKYTTLIAKLKSDGIPMYKRNVMILTNPVAAKKNVSINTVTYEWAPPVQNQALVNNMGTESFFIEVPGVFIWGSFFDDLINFTRPRSVILPGFSLL